MGDWAIRHCPKKHLWAFQHFAQNRECFRNIQSLEIRDFDWHEHRQTYGEESFQTGQGGFLNLFHGLKELHIVESKSCYKYGPRLRECSTEMKQCLQIFYQWYEDNAGTHPPQALRSTPNIIPHDYRRIEVRSDDGNREVGRIPCSLNKEEAA
ncbi:hypothetical protein N431DRAFT_335254 [Stipitochalara longipes BDJ]|nr:hypothetical protein N431DRAFT_335254 [Stipitochalara longipes BDJ]